MYMIFKSSSNLTRVLMQHSIIMKGTMIHFIFHIVFLLLRNYFMEILELLFWAVAYMWNKHFLVFSGREPVRVVDFERLQNLEAVVEEVSILVFQISTVCVTYSLDKNTGKITNMVIINQLALMHIVPLSRLLCKKIFWEPFGLLK